MIRVIGCFLLTATIWCAAARIINPQFEDARKLYENFKLKYKKSYSNEHDEYRFGVFKQNLLEIGKMQSIEEGTAEYGITKFADLTKEEFRAQYLGLKFDAPLEMDNTDVLEANSETDEHFDWREHGAVGPVLAQGKCGSCWAFSTVGNVEGQWFRKTGKFVQLSEQQLVDCDHLDHGCKGGFPPQAYGEIIRMGGLEPAEAYPYVAKSRVCHLESRKLAAYVNNSVVFPPDERLQAEKLKEIGPLSSALNADPLQFYVKGIVKLPRWLCSPQGMNHAVLTVGYGMEKGVPFWIVKNSWGADFGEQGYFRIQRGKGTCGIDRVVSTAIVK